MRDIGAMVSPDERYTGGITPERTSLRSACPMGGGLRFLSVDPLRNTPGGTLQSRESVRPERVYCRPRDPLRGCRSRPAARSGETRAGECRSFLRQPLVQPVNEEPGHLTGRKAHQITTAQPEAHSADPASNPTVTVIVDRKNVDRGPTSVPRVEEDLNSTVRIAFSANGFSHASSI